MAYEPKEPVFDGTRTFHSSRRVTRSSRLKAPSSRPGTPPRSAAKRTFAITALLSAPRIGGVRRTLPPLWIGRVTIALLVAVTLGVVHGDHPVPAARADEPAADAARAVPKERAFHGPLPESVAEMREEILAAIHAGDVKALGKAAAWSEARGGRRADFGAEAGDDPVGFWTRISADGAGREVLAIAANLLALPPARLAIGNDPENTFVYVWPYLAELPAHALTPTEIVDLLRLVPFETAEAMRDGRKWSWWRIAIAADGTWLAFRRYE